MTQFMRKSFTVGMPGSSEYRDNWEETFGANKRAAEATPPADESFRDLRDNTPRDLDLGGTWPKTESGRTPSDVPNLYGPPQTLRNLPEAVSDRALRARQFRYATGKECPSTPLTEGEANTRIKPALRLIVEEFFEVLYAALEGTEALRSMEIGVLDLLEDSDTDVDLPELAKELEDLDYVTEQCRVGLGINGEPIACLVHMSNMAKANGPRRPDGKVLKPTGWKAPDIAGELRRQGWEP